MQVTNYGYRRCGTCELNEQRLTKRLKERKERKGNANMNCKAKQSHLLHHMPTTHNYMDETDQLCKYA